MSHVSEGATIVIAQQPGENHNYVNSVLGGPVDPRTLIKKFE